MSTQNDHSTPGAALGIWRPIAGLVQGLALYLLYSAADAKVWPATDGFVFAPLLFVALFLPLVLALGLGNLRASTLAIWIAVAAAALAALALYGIWHDMPLQQNCMRHAACSLQPDLVPSPGLFFFTGVVFFIAHALIAGGDADRRFIATYHTHFDVAWKLGVQLVLSAAFVGVFWGLLELGARLFSLIDIDIFRRLIEHPWFAIPVTALAAVAAIHLTDVRASLVRGARTIGLVLLAWLLPLMTIIAAGFLAALVFTGLAPLWKTGHAAAYLLSAAGILVILINAAYQDGDSARTPPRILRYAGSVAALVLVPLAAIGAYGLFLRVRQYGWTADRVGTAACLAVAAFYAVGYAVAALSPGAWLARIERWNFFAALLVLAVLAAIFSPAADPDRIAVASQVSQLESGRISVEKFDFAWLRWNSGRFGMRALQKLAATGTPDVRDRARRLLAADNAYDVVAAAADVAANVTVYPVGKRLPPAFLHRDWSQHDEPGWIPACLRAANAKCDAYLLDLTGNGDEQIIVADRAYATLFDRAADGSWHSLGNPGYLWSCKSVLASLRLGRFSFAPPEPQHFRDVMVDGLRLSARIDPKPRGCPK